MSTDQIPAWVHLRPLELTISRPHNFDLALTDPGEPHLGWFLRTDSGTS